MLPTMIQGKDAIAALRREAHLFGGVMSEEAVGAADDLGDNVQRLTGFVTTLWRRLSANLIPDIDRVVRGMLEWIRANEELIDSGVVTAIDLVRKAIDLAWTSLKKVVFGLGFVVGFVTTIGQEINNRVIEPYVTALRMLGGLQESINAAPFKIAGLEDIRNFAEAVQRIAHWLGITEQHLERIGDMMKKATLRGLFAAIPGGAFIQGVRGIPGAAESVGDAAEMIKTRNQFQMLMHRTAAGEFSSGPMSMGPEVPQSAAPPGFRLPAMAPVPFDPAMSPAPQISIEANVRVETGPMSSPAEVGEAVKKATVEAVEESVTRKLLPQWRRPGAVKR